MHMILHATCDDRLTTEIGQNPTEITVQFFAHSLVTQKRSAFFRREHRVYENFCERLLRSAGLEPEAHAARRQPRRLRTQNVETSLGLDARKNRPTHERHR